MCMSTFLLFPFRLFYKFIMPKRGRGGRKTVFGGNKTAKRLWRHKKMLERTRLLDGQNSSHVTGSSTFEANAQRVRLNNIGGSSSEMSSSRTNGDDDLDDVDGINGCSEFKMRVGEMYQAKVPPFTTPALSPSEHYGPDTERESLLWSPNLIDDTEVKDFVELAFLKYRYNEEQALNFLHFHNCDIQKAKKNVKTLIPCPETWSFDEKSLFEQALEYFGKDFESIKKVLPRKSMHEVILHFYLWKNTHEKKEKRKLELKDEKKVNITRNNSNHNGASNGSESQQQKNSILYTKPEKKESFQVPPEQSQCNAGKKEFNLNEIEDAADNPASFNISMEKLRHEYSMCRRKIQKTKQECEHIQNSMGTIDRPPKLEFEPLSSSSTRRRLDR